MTVVKKDSWSDLQHWISVGREFIKIEFLIGKISSGVDELNPLALLPTFAQWVKSFLKNLFPLGVVQKLRRQNLAIFYHLPHLRRHFWAYFSMSRDLSQTYGWPPTLICRCINTPLFFTLDFCHILSNFSWTTKATETNNISFERPDMWLLKFWRTSM